MDEVFKEKKKMNEQAVAGVAYGTNLLSGFFQNGNEIYVLGTEGDYRLQGEDRSKRAKDLYLTRYTDNGKLVLPVPERTYRADKLFFPGQDIPSTEIPAPLPLPKVASNRKKETEKESLRTSAGPNIFLKPANDPVEVRSVKGRAAQINQKMAPIESRRGTQKRKS